MKKKKSNPDQLSRRQNCVFM